MRAIKRQRPRRREPFKGLSQQELQDLAGRASYIGSPEHKDIPSPAGHPRPRADASICDRSISRDFTTPTEWLRAAIRSGNIGCPMEGDFPRYAWYKNGTDLYEARLVNRDNGQYKGFPLERFEWPEFLV